MLSVLRKLGWFFRSHWKRYTVAIFIMTIAGILEVILPKLIGYGIDEIVFGRLTWNRLTLLLLGFGALVTVNYILTFFWMYQLLGGAFLVERALRSRLMHHFLQMTPTFFEKNRTGDLMARATNDLRSVSNTAGFGILTLIDSTEWLLLLFFVMGFTISWPLTLAALIPLPVIAGAMRYYGKTIHERFMKAQSSFGEMNDYVLESISGVRVVRAYVQEKADQDRFQQLTEKVYRKNIDVAKIDALFEPTIKILVGISYLIGISYGAYFVFHQSITLGDLISFNIYLGMVIWPMFAMGELINIMQRGNASLDRVEETLRYPADVRDQPDATPHAKPGDIEFSGVSFRYPTSDADNLRDISFVLRRGQTLGIAGRTGSGKTTLLKQLLREYPGGTGKITIARVPIESIPLQTLFGWIGYVPQDQILFSKTIRENILFGAPADSGDPESQLREAIEAASLSSDIEALPDGLETLVGEKGVALSGGQKQRVSIARAWIAHPEILLLDDAMSAVDAKTEAHIIANIRRRRAGKTTLIASHRLSAIMHADQILVLDEGRIVESGTHDRFMRSDSWYRKQFEHQQSEEDPPERGEIP